ncbi:MAG TPA: ABC transporter ATP-binding protein [Verrucomicrobiae bacterium]|nr:ABC transporter ATP-binding protein [Verrucomicrobiae bacterium]
MASELRADFVHRFRGGTEICIRDLRLDGGSQIHVLFGPSGAGKTTVLRCLAGLERPCEGSIQFEGETWLDAAAKNFVPPQSRRLGFVPQEYRLFPHLTVAQNVAYGLKRIPREQRPSRVGEVLEALELGGLDARLPREISGGQQQRVALARAIAPRPALLLLDEPLAALDQPARVRLRAELRRWLGHLGTLTVLVTHDRAEALALGDTLTVMANGRNIQSGKTAGVFNRPASADVAAIVAMETVLPGRIVERGELARVQVGDQRLNAFAGDLPAETRDVYVCIRAEDVILAPDERRSSARNALPGVVRELTPEGPLLRVHLDCGFPLTALVTRQSSEELALKPGARLIALIKAPQVHLIARSGTV